MISNPGLQVPGIFEMETQAATPEEIERAFGIDGIAVPWQILENPLETPWKIPKISPKIWDFFGDFWAVMIGNLA